VVTASPPVAPRLTGGIEALAFELAYALFTGLAAVTPAGLGGEAGLARDLPRGRLATWQGPPGRVIGASTARRIVEILGGHPFYLRLMGETLKPQDRPTTTAP
jgi:hypothetical protein